MVHVSSMVHLWRSKDNMQVVYGPWGWTSDLRLGVKHLYWLSNLTSLQNVITRKMEKLASKLSRLYKTVPSNLFPSQLISPQIPHCKGHNGAELTPSFYHSNYTWVYAERRLTTVFNSNSRRSKVTKELSVVLCVVLCSYL